MLASALLGSAVPALLCAAVLAIGWRARHGAGDRAWVAALAVAAGYAAGHVTIIGWPPFPPAESTHRVFYLAIASGLLGGLPWAASGWQRVRRGALALAVPALVLGPLMKRSWSVPQSAAWLVVSAVAIYALSAALESLAGRRAARSLPLALTVGVALASAVLLVSGSALVAQLAGALASALGALAVGAWLWPERCPAGAALPFACVFSTLLLIGHHYAEMPGASAFLLVAFPLSAWLLEIGPLRRLRGWASAAAAALFAGAPAALAALIAWNARSDSGGY